MSRGCSYEATSSPPSWGEWAASTRTLAPSPSILNQEIQLLSGLFFIHASESDFVWAKLSRAGWWWRTLLNTHSLRNHEKPTLDSNTQEPLVIWPWTRQLIPPGWDTDPFNCPEPQPSHKAACKNKMRNSSNPRNYTTIHCVPYELWIG